VSDCGHYRELVGGYVLGALEPDEAALVERHLGACPRCGREYGELASLPALLDAASSADAEPEAPPASLEEAVLDRFAREHRRRAPLRRRPRRALVAAAALAGAALAAAVVLLVAGVFSSSPDSAFGHAWMERGGATAAADLRAVDAGTGVRLRVRGLAGRPGGYELWCISKRGRWISGGTFRVDSRGRADVQLTSAARPGDYLRVLITRAGERRKLMAGHVEY
jgi:anti-sigma factor RsiW